MPDAVPLPTGNPSHSAHHFETVTVYYRWHPLFGQSLRVRQRKKDHHGEWIVCQLIDDTSLSIPAWMLSPDCTQFTLGPPQIGIAALLELRDLLSALQAPPDCAKASLTSLRQEAAYEAASEVTPPAVESVFAERVGISGSRQQANGADSGTGRTSDQCGERRRRATSQRRGR